MRRLACLTALFGLLLAVPGLAGGGAPDGKYRGIQRKAQEGNGSAHKVSFTVRRGRLRRLVIGAGQAYCHPPSVRQPGFAPGYFDAPSPRLSRFPAVRLRKRGNPRRYYVRATFKRTGSRWKITRSRSRLEGPGYVTIAGYFKGKRFNRLAAGNLKVQYGADAEGMPKFALGPQQCDIAGRLGARRR